MGYTAHDAVIAAVGDWEPETLERIEAFVAELPEDFRHLLVGSVEVTNGYRVYAFLPDGSKEGWPESDDAQRYRVAFYELVRRDAVHVRFGGDFGEEVGTEIVSSTDPVRREPPATIPRLTPESIETLRRDERERIADRIESGALDADVFRPAVKRAVAAATIAERERIRAAAAALIDAVLDRPFADPDDDAARAARALQRLLERVHLA